MKYDHKTIRELRETEKEQVGSLPVSSRLRMIAEVGSKVSACNPPEENVNDFADHLINVGGFLPPDAFYSADFYREQIHVLHMAYRWARSGFNAFDLTRGLAAALMLTDPPGSQTEVEELKVPFPSFAILLPEGIIPMWINGEQVWADMVWVHRFQGLRKATQTTEQFIRWTCVWKHVQLWADRDPRDLTLQDEYFYNRPELGDPPPAEEDTITTESGLRLLQNLLAWLDATKALNSPQKVKQSRKRKRKVNRKGSVVKPTVWVLGRQVKLRPELRQMASELALSRSKKPVKGWKVRSQHIVRGHWKFQAYGPQRSLRKRLWVEPYFRGPEGSEAWAHVYNA